LGGGDVWWKMRGATGVLWYFVSVFNIGGVFGVSISLDTGFGGFVWRGVGTEVSAG
jgi:hypothetical protein